MNLDFFIKTVEDKAQVQATQGLWEYQARAHDNVYAAYRAGHRSVMVVLFAGGGKTRVASSIAANWPHGLKGVSQRVMFLAHRNELLHQGRGALSQATGRMVDTEKAAERSSQHSRVIVASVQTMQREARLKRFRPDEFGLIIIDECFPSGTLVDGRPIESVCVGDVVSCVDHDTGHVGRGRVARVFKKRSRTLWKLCYDETEIVSTANHPYFVKGRGYVAANEVAQGDMLCVWRGTGETGVSIATTEALLRRGVQEEALRAHTGGYKSKVRQRSHEDEQPNASWGQPGEDEGDPEAHGAHAEGARWEREWGYEGRTGDGSRDGRGVDHAVGGKNGALQRRQRIPSVLQDRPGQPEFDGWNRSGRRQPRLPITQGAGQEEGGFLAWVRVDHSSSVEPTSPGGDTVYNLEVEGAHTYFANGVLVHNCHRAAGTASYKTIMDYFPAAKLLLLTATPMRADKKSMGLITNHVAVHHDMAWGVREGYILEPEVHSIFIQSIDISQVTITAGDLNKAEQDAVFSVEETQLGIARATLDNIGDRTTILFSGPSVATAEKLTEILNRPAFKPGCARLVHADTPEDERREIKAQHEAGEFQILVNVGIYTEGYDSPKVSAIVLARMTKSRTLLEQMACRGDRLLPGIGSLPTREQRLAAIAASAKPKFLLIDFHGNMGRHNLATMVDVFAGEYTEAIKARAKELLKEEALTPTQALEKAQEEHDKKEAKKAQRAALRRSQMSATVRWTSKVFNPFALLGIPEMGVLPRGEVKLASLRDARLLEEAGFKPPVEGWTHEVASVVVEEMRRRKSLGLCSARMVATLKRVGVDATSMPMEKAGYLIGALKRNREQHKFWGWLPGQKDRIMRGARE